MMMHDDDDENVTFGKKENYHVAATASVIEPG